MGIRKGKTGSNCAQLGVLLFSKRIPLGVRNNHEKTEF